MIQLTIPLPLETILIPGIDCTTLCVKGGVYCITSPLCQGRSGLGVKGHHCTTGAEVVTYEN